MAELAELSDKIRVETHDLVVEAEDASRKVRHFGIPAGYEFALLIEAVPKTMINRSGGIEGAVPEAALLDRITRAATA